MEVARVPRVAAALAGLALCGSSMAAAFIHGSPGWKLAAAAACLCAVFASCSEWIRARRSIVGDAELRGWVERDREARAVEGRASDEARELEEAIGVAEEKPAPTAKKRRL